jgi:RNA polymerase sigma-70 factor (ECF subfamily)
VQQYSPERSRTYESFLRTHGDAVLRFLRRRADPQTADDAFSETMLVVWRRFDEVPDEPLPWLYVTARNCLRNAERSLRRQQRVVDRITAIDPPPQATTADDDGDPREECLHAALARLSNTDAEVLRLWAWEELGPQEIATVMQISVNAATIRLHRAKKKVRQEMDAVCPPVGETTTRGGAR